MNEPRHCRENEEDGQKDAQDEERLGVSSARFIQSKFIPKKPVKAVTGRKINETKVNRLICSPCRWAIAVAKSCIMSDIQRRRS